MKKISALFLALMLTLGMLAGCSDVLDEVIPPQTVTIDDLTITLPGYFIDWSSEDWAEGLPFVYGFNSSAVLGIKEDVATLEATIPGLTAKDYADLFVESNDLTSTVSEEDGLVTFTYSATSEGTQITYLCGVFKGTTNFWVVQCYCATEDYAKFQADFLSTLKSVQVI